MVIRPRFIQKVAALASIAGMVSMLGIASASAHTANINAHANAFNIGSVTANSLRNTAINQSGGMFSTQNAAVNATGNATATANPVANAFNFIGLLQL